MMRRHTVLLAALAALALTAGCLGGADEEDPDQLERAQAGEDTGGLEGLVTTPAVEPIPGANVSIDALGAHAETAEDGSYALSELPPGSYTLTVNATGYQGAEKDVDVTAGEVESLDIVLAKTRAADPYTQSLELSGFFECGFAAGVDASAAPPPANVSEGIISWPTCATVNSLTGNATNDRFDHHYRLEPAIQTMVVETAWTPSAGSLSDQLWVDIVPEGHHCGNITMCDWSLLDHWGPSPLKGVVDRERFEHVQQHFDRRCENGEDEYCGEDFFAEGWPLWIRVYPRWECQPTGAQACVLLQQEFQHIVTAFYHEPAPEGFSALN